MCRPVPEACARRLPGPELRLGAAFSRLRFLVCKRWGHKASDLGTMNPRKGDTEGGPDLADTRCDV